MFFPEVFNCIVLAAHETIVIALLFSNFPTLRATVSKTWESITLANLMPLTLKYYAYY